MSMVFGGMGDAEMRAFVLSSPLVLLYTNSKKLIMSCIAGSMAGLHFANRWTGFSGCNANSDSKLTLVFVN